MFMNSHDAEFEIRVTEEVKIEEAVHNPRQVVQQARLQ